MGLYESKRAAAWRLGQMGCGLPATAMHERQLQVCLECLI